MFFVHPKPTYTVQFCEDGQILGFPTHSDTFKSSISAGRDSKPSTRRWVGDGKQTALPLGGHPAAPGLSPQIPLHGCLQHPRVTLAAPRMRGVKHCFIYLPVHLGGHRQKGPGARRYPLGLVLGALQVRVVLLYRVQRDVADVARVAALQACKEKPEVLVVHRLSILE